MKLASLQPLLIGAALIGSLWGCGSGDKGATENTTAPTDTSKPADGTAANGKEFKITVIAKSNDNPVFQAAKNGALKAAEDFTKSTGTKITIDWRTPDKEDGQEQASRLEAAVSGGTNAVLLSCSDASKVTGAIDAAVAKGVTVMTFDSDAPASKREAFYGADDLDCGHQVAMELAKQVGTAPTNVAILAGNQNAPNLQKRVQGVKEELAKTSTIKVVDVFYHNESPQDAAAKVQEVMSAHPEINAWAMVGGWPLFTTTLLNELDPAKVKIVAVDCLPAQMPYIEKGICPVLLAQPCFKWGYEGVRMIVDKAISKKDVPAINKMELVAVTKDKLGEWGKQLKDWGFEGVDPKYLTK